MYEKCITFFHFTNGQNFLVDLIYASVSDTVNIHCKYKLYKILI
uniref:ZP domain-containing protein n=1 Tax=Heterorhabditis bacteriophora TaxID=37862 RepID=A0A1I7WR20_HETBA